MKRKPRPDVVERNFVHGYAAKGKTPTYRTWVNMKSRCNNPNVAHFDNYGGRGIRVCERWSSFEAFLADMGEKPPRASIERIDNDKGYEPGNCRWASVSEQARNRRSTVLLTFNGKTQCVKDWAEEMNLTQDCLEQRIRNGWTVERALTQARQTRSG